MADFSDFNTGSGLGLNGVREVEFLFAGVPLTLTGAWLTWMIFKSYRGWASGKLSLYDMSSVIIQAFIVTGMIVTLLAF